MTTNPPTDPDVLLVEDGEPLELPGQGHFLVRWDING